MSDPISQPVVQALLSRAAAVICKQLKQLLPTINPNWWQYCVAGKLSFQQREQLDRRRITTLDELDLAAFLRIIDQNWFELADTNRYRMAS